MKFNMYRVAKSEIYILYEYKTGIRVLKNIKIQYIVSTLNTDMVTLARTIFLADNGIPNTVELWE